MQSAGIGHHAGQITVFQLLGPFQLFHCLVRGCGADDARQYGLNLVDHEGRRPVTRQQALLVIVFELQPHTAKLVGLHEWR